VLSGNRNFEGRIQQDVRANYLASPPLVVAYALAGRMQVDLTTEPLGSGSDVPLTKELMLDRWRGLCQAVTTGKTDALMRNAYELYQTMDDETKAGLKLQAECTSKAKDCAEYAKCSE